jgi:hypothetical protein
MVVNKRRLWLIATGLLIAVLLFGRSNRMQSNGGDTLLWNRDEAFVIVTRSDWGWRGSYAQAVFWLVEGLVRGHNPPTDGNRCNLMIRITPAKVDRVLLPDDFSLRGVCKSEMYAVMKGGFWKWSGNEFVSIPRDEWARIEGTLGSSECPSISGYHYSSEPALSFASPVWRAECKDRCDFSLPLNRAVDRHVYESSFDQHCTAP